jgi:hypothetical protein
MGGETSAGAIVRHLHELKAALQLVGYVTTIGEPHYLTVVNPEVSRLSEVISCRRHHADDEQLWFFYSFGEPIAAGGAPR